MFMEARTTQHLYTEQNAQYHPLVNYIYIYNPNMMVFILNGLL